MTTGIAPESVDGLAARPRRRLSSRMIAGVGAGLALVLAASGWWLWSGVSAGRIEVAWTPACKGAEVSRYSEPAPMGNDELQGEFVIDARPGFSCSLSITVRNDSRHAALISAVHGSFLGPDGGAEVMGGTTTDTPILDPESNGRDAAYPLDRELPAGDSMTIDIAVSWREAGCNSGGYLSFGNWPVVELELLGRSHETSADQYLVLRTHDGDHQARGNSNC